MGKPETGYVLGHSDRELERLKAQAELYEGFTTEFPRAAGIEAGMRVLDVGCGAGDVSFLAARMGAEVVGVDRAPAALETARRRALELGLANARFVEGDAGGMAFAERFDAVVGRFVLMFLPDATGMVRRLSRHPRPGGVMAFQEIDYTGCRALPELATLRRCARWITAAVEGSGADPYFGLRLHATFRAAGLPAPGLLVDAAIGAGAEHPLYSMLADLVRTLLPALEEFGVATAAEVEIESLERRLGEEAAARNATVVGPSLVGAFSRKPDMDRRTRRARVHSRRRTDPDIRQTPPLPPA